MNVLVNKSKQKRAELIVGLVSGKLIPKNDGEQERKDKFAAFMSDAKVDPKGVAAVEFVYAKLGGLVRTEAEQKAADVRRAQTQAKAKKKMIE